MRVRAKEVCFVDNRLRQAGDEFSYDGEVIYGWLEPLDQKKDAEPEVEDQAPSPEPIAVKRGPGRPKKNPTAAT